MPCINDQCDSSETCCRKNSFMPKEVDRYRNYIRTSDFIGFVDNISPSAMQAFYSNISYAFQNLEYIYRDTLKGELTREVHPTIKIHYIKTYFTVSFSIIESTIEAALIKNGTISAQDIIDPSQRTPFAKTIIDKAQSAGLISQTLRNDLQDLRKKRNKVHLSKILETSGVDSFEEYDWNAFSIEDVEFASKCLLGLIVEISNKDKMDATLNQLFDFLYEAEAM